MLKRRIALASRWEWSIISLFFCLLVALFKVQETSKFTMQWNSLIEIKG